MKKLKQYSLAILLTSLVFATSWSKDEDDAAVTPAPTKTLYERLGKVEAITLVTDKFLTYVVADNRINASFAETVKDTYRTQLLRANLIDQISAAAGGPALYKGKSMAESHKGMNITEAQFNALVEDLGKALTDYKVPTAEQTELVNILAPLKSDIVGK
jgi:hemoglobin